MERRPLFSCYNVSVFLEGGALVGCCTGGIYQIDGRANISPHFVQGYAALAAVDVM